MRHIKWPTHALICHADDPVPTKTTRENPKLRRNLYHKRNRFFHHYEAVLVMMGLFQPMGESKYFNTFDSIVGYDGRLLKCPRSR